MYKTIPKISKFVNYILTKIFFSENKFEEAINPSKKSFVFKRILSEHMKRYVFASKFIKNKVCLDVACGFGYGTHYLKSKGAKKVMGIDKNKKFLEYSKSRYSDKSVTFLKADATRLPIKSNSVNVVISFETIEHIKDYNRFVSEIYRVLRKNGLLILSTPNKTVWEFLVGKGSLASPYHVKEFTTKELRFIISRKFDDNIKFFCQRPFIKNRFSTPLRFIVALIKPAVIKKKTKNTAGFYNIIIVKK